MVPWRFGRRYMRGWPWGSRDDRRIEHGGRRRTRGEAMGPARPRHRLHGGDGQRAIRLDAVHQSDRSEIRLGHHRAAMDLLDRHRDGNVRRNAFGRIFPRSFRSKAGLSQRSIGRGRLVPQFDRRCPPPLLRRRRDLRPRHGARVRRRIPERAEMVPRPARLRHRTDRRRLRGRRRRDGRAPRQHDQAQWLRGRLPVVRHRPGACRPGERARVARTATRRTHGSAAGAAGAAQT